MALPGIGEDFVRWNSARGDDKALGNVEVAAGGVRQTVQLSAMGAPSARSLLLLRGESWSICRMNCENNASSAIWLSLQSSHLAAHPANGVFSLV